MKTDGKYSGFLTSSSSIKNVTPVLIDWVWVVVELDPPAPAIFLDFD
jgi:hypothetical protein